MSKQTKRGQKFPILSIWWSKFQQGIDPAYGGRTPSNRAYFGHQFVVYGLVFLPIMLILRVTLLHSLSRFQLAGVALSAGLLVFAFAHATTSLYQRRLNTDAMRSPQPAQKPPIPWIIANMMLVITIVVLLSRYGTPDAF